jgi:hypothetical protein
VQFFRFVNKKAHLLTKEREDIHLLFNDEGEQKKELVENVNPIVFFCIFVIYFLKV